MQITRQHTTNIIWALALIAAVLAISWVSSQDFKSGVLVLAGILGAALSVLCFRSPQLGFYITITTVIVVRFFARVYGEDLPVGAATDLMMGSSIIGLMLRKGPREKSGMNFLKEPIMLLLYVQFLYDIIQVFNPNSYSKETWVLYMRLMIRYLMFLVLVIQVFRSMTDVRRFFRYWLGLSTFVAFYGCIQEWFGLMPFELAFLLRTPEALNTVLINGHMRIFSTMSDPAVMGLMMALGAILCLILLTASNSVVSPKRKIWLAISLLLHLLACAYSGTRTGFVMVPAGMLVFLLVNLHKRNAIIAAMIFGCFGAALLFGPFYGNATINRVRSAFVGTQDASLNVREVNRHHIQPYIYAHPIGGGIFTAGGEGKTYNPGHPLAGFPPDSGYLRVALELGWIMLLLTCIYYCVLLSYAISNYFRATEELDKLLHISITCMLFAVTVSMYSQEAGGLMESAFFTNVLAGIAIKSKYLL
ncbi:O-antigen ligase family protein [Chitinophaga vietnamensis]|uniref:O-antigen ligase family protein n=1 Tax=Chitinophaga vietnamensis TaxID=2593957 RepID=UPI001178BE3B|nr:O-antigen ligase family protein [Chitinophaga vietnamensis]